MPSNIIPHKKQIEYICENADFTTSLYILLYRKIWKISYKATK